MDSTIEQHSKISTTWSDNWWQVILHGHVSNMSKKASGWLGVKSRQSEEHDLVWHFCWSFDSSKVERVQQRRSRAVYCNKSVKKSRGTIIYLPELECRPWRLGSSQIEADQALFVNLTNKMNMYTVYFDQPALPLHYTCLVWRWISSD